MTPPAHAEKEKEEPKQHSANKVQPLSGDGPAPRLPFPPIPAGNIGPLSTNYSVAPGYAWVELTNPAAITVASNGTVSGNLPIWGAGDLLAKLSLPIGVVVVAPTTIPGTFNRNRVNQTLPPIPATPPITTTAQAQLVSNLWLPAPLVTSDTPVAVGPATTGMSVQGFPSLPQPISQASVLPSGLGVQSASINNTTIPPTITVQFAGAGTVPANSRWLIFTIVGV
jgi:hypothetical protein